MTLEIIFLNLEDLQDTDFFLKKGMGKIQAVEAEISQFMAPEWVKLQKH